MRVLLLTCAALLFLALATLPIGYYTFLRIIITIVAVFIVIKEFKGEINGWVIAFGLIAVFFNPVWPVYLNEKSDWIIPDALAAIIFVLKAFNESTLPKLKKNE